MGNTWGADIADTQVISKYNKRISFFVLLIISVNMHGLFH